MVVLERLLSRSERTGACLLWTGCTVRGGYGQIRINGYGEYVHRVMYQLVHGEIPREDDVCHTCDTPNCIEPDHLALGTHAENMFDMVRKGRSPRGRAKLTEDNVQLIRASKEPISTLAAKFNVHKQTIWSIRNRITWGHIK